MSSPTRALEAVHLATLGSLTGAVVLDPTAAMRRAPDYAGWLAGQQRVDRVMSRVAPPLFLSTAATALAAGVVALVQRRPAAAAGRFVRAARGGRSSATCASRRRPEEHAWPTPRTRRRRSRRARRG